MYSKQVKVLLALFIFSLLPFSKALASNNLLCKISFQSYYISMDGCELSVNKTGKFSYKLNGSSVDAKTCSGSDLTDKKEFEEFISSNKVSGDKGLLLVNKYSNGFSGKIITNLFSDAGLDLPLMKKDSMGIAKANMDNGLTIWLQIEDKANLRITGDFGTIEMNGPCQNY
jgi:hypothetical protein